MTKYLETGNNLFAYTIMKNTIKTTICSLVLALSVLSVSCTKEIIEQPYLNCDAPGEIIFNADGTSENSIVFIESNLDWNVTISENSWLEIAEKNKSSFILKAKVNNTPSIPEEATITISADDFESIIISARQLSGKYNLSINPDIDKLNFNAEGEVVLEDGEILEKIVFTVDTDLDNWTVALSNDQSWLNCETDIEKSSFTLSAAKNENNSNPEDITVSITYNGETIKSITATQEAFDPSVPMTDISLENVPDGTKFIITYINNLSKKSFSKDGKLSTRGLAGDITTIYSISSEITGEILIGREQDEKIILSFDENGNLKYRSGEDGRMLVNTVAELIKINENEETLAGKYSLESSLHLLGEEFMLGQPSAQRLVWEPIGKATSNWSGVDKNAKTVFKGEFDGNNHEIKGLYSEGDNYLGLFGCTGEDAILEEINVTSGYCKTEKNSGLICGYNFGEIRNCSGKSETNPVLNFGSVCGVNGNTGKIFKCINSNNTSGTYYFGGICSDNKGLISECENNAAINIVKGETTRYIGGICGINFGTIEKCINTTDILDNEIEAMSIGGICGVNQGIIDQCSNSGYIKGFSDIGGISGTSNGRGLNNPVYISNCLNTGKVEGIMKGSSLANPTGGITGSNMFAKIYSCINEGEIIGYLEAGGISGYFYGGEVYSCHNKGKVDGANSVGGVIGYIATDPDPMTKLYSCYNIGEVTAYEDYYKGGVCGENYGEIIDCFYLGYDGIEGVGHSREETRTYKFSEEQWPSSATDGWGTGNGTEYNTYWKTLGKYVSGGTPDGVSSEFPKLWWEE